MTYFIPRTLALLLVTAVVGACNGNDQSAREPVPSFESVLNSQDATRITAWFTDDAALLPENLRRVAGRADILQCYQDLT
jgi:ketosteroid isomerase-like protein